MLKLKSAWGHRDECMGGRAAAQKEESAHRVRKWYQVRGALLLLLLLLHVTPDILLQQQQTHPIASPVGTL
jgi:hypothetical protein